MFPCKPDTLYSLGKIPLPTLPNLKGGLRRLEVKSEAGSHCPPGLGSRLLRSFCEAQGMQMLKVTGRFQTERATNKAPKSPTQNISHRAPVTQPAASSACHQTSAPRKHVTALKDGHVQTPSGATEPPTTGSGNNATLLFLTEPPCPALPPPSAQARVEVGRGPGAQRAHSRPRQRPCGGPGASRELLAEHHVF